MKPDFVIAQCEYYHLKNDLFIVKYSSAYEDGYNFDLVQYGISGFIVVDVLDTFTKKLTKRSLEKVKKEALETLLELEQNYKEDYLAYRNFMFNKELKGVLND